MNNLSKGLSSTLLDIRFAWRWGKIWGVAPSLDSCPDCGSPLRPGEGVVMTEWGFLCDGCRASSSTRQFSVPYKPVSPEVFDIIKLACLSPADAFVRAEPEVRAYLASYSGLDSEVGNIASRLFVFLTFTS
jgi:recombinational DNA repair protein (RecF pathway)